MKLVYIMLCALFVTGCVSTPMPVSQAVNVQADRYFWTEKPKTTNPGKLVLIRDTGFVGLLVNANVTIDDKPLAALAPGEKAEVRLDPDPDEYVIQVSIGGAGGSITSANQAIKSGQTYYYRIYTDGDGYIHLMRMKKID